MPRRYSQGVYKNKQEIEKYRKVADRIFKESKTYEKESKLAIIGIIVCVLMLALTPLVILYKKKHKKVDLIPQPAPGPTPVSTTVNQKFNDLIL